MKVSENDKHNAICNKEIRKEMQQTCVRGLRDALVNRYQALSNDNAKEEEGNENNQSSSIGQKSIEEN